MEKLGNQHSNIPGNTRKAYKAKRGRNKSDYISKKGEQNIAREIPPHTNRGRPFTILKKCLAEHSEVPAPSSKRIFNS